MVQEMAVVITAVVSSLSALGGVALTWALGNISAESKDRRFEREAARRRLEDKYVQTLADVELYIRAPQHGETLDEKLAMIGASMMIFAGENVRRRFDALGDALSSYVKVINFSDKKPLLEYSSEHPDEWKIVVAAVEEFAAAMRIEIRDLHNF